MDVFHRAIDAIDRANTIAIAGHENPDGDCYGSILGLGLSLIARGKKVRLFADERLAHFAYLPGFERLEDVDTATSFDLVIRVDLGGVERMGRGQVLFTNAKTTLNFDHHVGNDGRATIAILDEDASSTCEIIGRFLLEAGFPLPEDAATSLYAGLITDSNRYLYDTAGAHALRLGADLLDHGADAQSVYLHEYQMLDPKRVAFEGEVVREALFLHDGKMAVANVTREKIAPYGLSMSEAEGVVDTLRSLRGVEVAVILKEQESERQKISFRSKEYFNVRDLAASFGGGGHIKAAGAAIAAKNAEAWKILVERLGEVSLG